MSRSRQHLSVSNGDWGDTMSRKIYIGVLATVVLSLCACGGGGAVGSIEQPLTSEPARGELNPREVVFVDDGSCPAGSVKRLTGAVDLSGSRQRQCVPKP